MRDRKFPRQRRCKIPRQNTKKPGIQQGQLRPIGTCARPSTNTHLTHTTHSCRCVTRTTWSSADQRCVWITTPDAGTSRQVLAGGVGSAEIIRRKSGRRYNFVCECQGPGTRVPHDALCGASRYGTHHRTLEDTQRVIHSYLRKIHHQTPPLPPTNTNHPSLQIPPPPRSSLTRTASHQAH